MPASNLILDRNKEGNVSEQCKQDGDAAFVLQAQVVSIFPHRLIVLCINHILSLMYVQYNRYACIYAQANITKIMLFMAICL